MKVKRTRTRSIFSILLAVALIVSMMPSFAFADTETPDTNVVKYDSGDEAEWVMGTNEYGENVRTGCKWMQVDGKYYYDVYGGQSPEEKGPYGDYNFAINAVNAEPTNEILKNTSNPSIIGKWSEVIGFAMNSVFGDFNNPEFTEFSVWDGDSGTRPLLEDALRSSSEKKIYCNSGGYKKRYQITGLKTASSLSAVRAQVQSVQSDTVDPIYTGFWWLGDQTLNLKDKQLAFLKDDKNQDVVYNMYCVAKGKGDGGKDLTEVDTAVIAFYDFQFRPIISEDIPFITKAEGKEQIKEASGREGVSYKDSEKIDEQISYFENETLESTSVSQSFSRSVSESISNSFSESQSHSTSQSHSFSVNFGAETEAGAIIAKTKLSLGLGYSFGTGSSEGKTVSKDYSQSQTNNSSSTVNSSLTLPAQTAAEISTFKQKTYASLDYDCPVELTYKVYFGVVYHEISSDDEYFKYKYGKKQGGSEIIFGSTDASVGNTAVESLSNFVKNQKVDGYSDRQDVNHCLYYDGNDTDVRQCHIQYNKDYYGACSGASSWLNSHSVMSTTGSTMDYNLEIQGQEIEKIIPLYKLYGVTLEEFTQFGDFKIADDGSIKVINDDFKDAYELHDFRLNKGEVFYPRSLTLSPYNENMCNYYGFKAAYGKWHRVKKVQDGDNVKWEIDDEDNPEADKIAKIVKDEESGYQRIDAGNEEGTVYFQYFIDEDKYKSKEETEYTKNSDVTDGLPRIKIHVVDKQFKGTVKFREDNFKAETGTTYNLKGVFDPAVYDEKGNLVNRPIEWEFSEATKEKLNNEDFTFDDTNGDITFNKEGKYTVIAGTGEATKAEYTIVVKNPKLSLDAFSKTINTGEKFILTLSDSSVDNPNPADYIWTSSDEDVATVSQYGKVTGVAAGTAIITVNNGKGSSVSCEVTVKDVAEQPFEGIILFGNNTTFKVVSGDSFNLNDKLKPVVFDKEENLVEKTVSWKLDPLTTLKALNGEVTLNNETGDISFSKDGEYTLIASVGNAKAEITITVEKEQPEQPEQQEEQQQTGGGSGGGGGGGSDQTTPTNNVDVNGSVTTENGEKVANADVSSKVDELIKNVTTTKAKEVAINVKSSQDVDKVNVTLPADAFAKLAEAGVENAVITTNVCDFAIDKTALREIAAQAPEGAKLTLEAVESPSSNELQTVYDLRILAGTKEISKFNGGQVTVTVDVPAKLKGQAATCLYKSDKGVYEPVTVVPRTLSNSKLSFVTQHFSTYVVMSELNGGSILVKQAKPSQSVKAKKNKKISVSFKNLSFGNLVADDSVKYTVQRSTNKNFKKSVKSKTLKGTSSTVKYTDSKKLKKGTKYYYRVRGTAVLSDGSKVNSKWSSVKSAKCK